MKKIVTIMLVCVLMSLSVSAFAAGRVSIVDDSFYVIKDYRTYGYSFAKVENTGNKPVTVHAGILEVFDENGDAITSSDNLSMYAKQLAPGEYTYTKMSAEIGGDFTVKDVDDYMLTVTGKTDSSVETTRYECSAEYQPDVTYNKYYTYDYIYVTVKNDTDEMVYGMRVVAALYDQEDNIILVTNDYLDSNEALLPGSSVMFRIIVDDSYTDYYDANGIVPSYVDAIAYTNVTN